MKMKKKGITLIELVMTMAILGIIMATVTIVFTSNSNILSKVDMKSELQLDAQIIQEQLSTVALEC
ncbi:type II secretion system protein, partial [Acinetobacter baumannii]